MVEPSSELEAVVRRQFAAVNDRDLPTILNLHADEPGVLMIGTDPDEWWSGFQVLRGIYEAQVAEFDSEGVTIEPGPIEAYSEGTVGWTACRPTLHFSDGSTATTRCTAVLHLDRGVWRFVQSHISVGVANEEALGFEMTTTIDQIVAVVQEERPNLAKAVDLNGTATIVFSDIEGSTELAVELGDHLWLDVVQWLDGVVAGITAAHGGHVVKSLGDGHMLAFSSASSALRAAADLQRRLQDGDNVESVRLRVGLHTGEVLRHSDDFFGRTVIMAARVAASAVGHEVLTTSLVVDSMKGSDTFKFGRPRTATLKGIPGNHTLYPLVWADTLPERQLAGP